jgi:hypothetical protein
VLKAESAGSIGLAVYDRSGRLLAQVLNQNDSNLQAGGARQDEFLGIRSKVPIVRARFFRAGEAGAKLPGINFDDLVFDRVVSVDRESDRACLWLTSGERLAGKLAAPPKGVAPSEDHLLFSPEFLDSKQPPVKIPASEIERYEPPVTAEASLKTLKYMGTPHAVLLQNGECFRARLMKMNEQTVVFVLPGGVELELPRAVIRKVDLQPAKTEPGELPAPITVGADDKPNVDLKTKEESKQSEKEKKDPAAEKPKEEKPKEEKPKEEKPKDPKDAKDPKDPKDPNESKDPKADDRNPAPPVSHMDNAEVVEVDPEQGLVTIRDEDGDLPVGLPSIKSFVLPKDPNAAKFAPKFRDWILTLREGSRFEIFLMAITPEGVTAEMSGGTVVLPSHVIESVQRQHRK